MSFKRDQFCKCMYNLTSTTHRSTVVVTLVTPDRERHHLGLDATFFSSAAKKVLIGLLVIQRRLIYVNSTGQYPPNGGWSFSLKGDRVRQGLLCFNFLMAASHEAVSGQGIVVTEIFD